MTSPGEFADAHVAAFNAAVRSGDFAGFLTGFEADAVIRFENVPGAGVLEFAGRSAYTAAYTAQPPDDQIDIAGPPGEQDGLLVIPFRWRRDGATGTMRLTRNGDRIAGMTVTFS